MSDVIVVGAGISGLAAAYELHRRGVRPLVLEASGRVGGLILTEREGPFLLDAGPDAMLATKPAAVALCRELGLGDRLIPTTPPRTAFVLRGGRLHPLPQPAVLGIPATWRALARASLISWRGRARMALAPLSRLSTGTGASDESIGSFIGRRYGREAVDYIAEPLLAGIHAGDVDRLSVRALFPSLLAGPERPGAPSERPGAPCESAFVSFPEGMTELTDTLVRALPRESIRCNAVVERLERTAGGYYIHIHGSAPVDARAVILAAPAWAAAALAAPLDAHLESLLAAIPYTSSAIVVLAYDRQAVRHPLAGSGFVVPRVERAPILAATWISSKWPGRAPAHRVLLRAFLGGARDPDAVERSDAALAGAATSALAPILGIRGAPLVTRVYRWRRASAQHEVGHLARLDAIDGRLERWPGLLITGSGFRVTGIPDCIADARAVAERAANYLLRSLRGLQ